ncbi:peptide deformylase [Kluyvera sichuanensis]|uniref:peptide deformylase n=1 Tax=Kluyvera sichuanensis TaxID=2725494 RepID=UPI0039F67E47
MAIREIIKVPDNRLRVTSQHVVDIDSVQGVINDMLDTLYSTDNGIGLAAPQVGLNEAIVIIDLSETRDQPLILINPIIIKHEGLIESEEGCLSVPGFYANVNRYQKIKVQALDREGGIFYVENDDYLAIVIQHEIDHLHGKIFIDYLSPLKQKMIMKRIQKKELGFNI